MGGESTNQIGRMYALLAFLRRHSSSRTPDSGMGHFFEFRTEPKAFLTSLSDSIDSDSKNWADAQLTQIKDSDVARVQLTLLDGSACA